MQLTPEQVQSVNILLNAVQVAQRRGAFSLQDAATLQEAVDTLVPREEQERQRQAALDQANQEDSDAEVSLEASDSDSEDQVEESGDSSEEDQVDGDFGSD